jgi:hypothetical protein
MAALCARLDSARVIGIDVGQLDFAPNTDVRPTRVTIRRSLANLAILSKAGYNGASTKE